MGAAKILMASSSELGPVDPQIFKVEDRRVKTFSAYALVTGYDKLFAEAVKTKGKLEPYMQQLQNYDDREINTYRSLIGLSEDIAVRALKTGMMASIPEIEIKKKIQVFLNPSAGTLAHGRPIYEAEGRACGLVSICLPPHWLQRILFPASGTAVVSGSWSTTTSDLWPQARHSAVTAWTPFSRMLPRVMGGPRYFIGTVYRYLHLTRSIDNSLGGTFLH
jgi:hypothetical protein